MNDDRIRLTSYFRERQRAEGRAIADALTGLAADSEVTASIVLRGTEGLSAAIAVSPRPHMEVLLGQVVELVGPGLVTVGQARLLTGDIDPVWLGEQPGEATMLTVHFGRQDHVYQVPAFEAVCELLYRRGIAGATVLPGTGSTIRGRRRHPHPHRHDDAPVMVVGYQGDWTDPGTGLVYMNARWYNLATGTRPSRSPRKHSHPPAGPSKVSRPLALPPSHRPSHPRQVKATPALMAPASPPPQLQRLATSHTHHRQHDPYHCRRHNRRSRRRRSIRSRS